MSQSKAGAQVKDLMNRLNNAVKQRNAAREEALLASEKLKVHCSCGRMLPQRNDAMRQPTHLFQVPTWPKSLTCAKRHMQKLEEDLDSGRLAPAGPTPSPGAATPLGTPTADGAAPDEPGVPRPPICCHVALPYQQAVAMF